MTRTRLAAAALLVGLSLLSPAAPRASAAPPAAPAPAVFAAGSYWAGFVDFWTGAFKKQSGVVLAALGVGAVSLFIITRAKWKK